MGRRISYKNWEAITEDFECKLKHLYTISLFIMYVGWWQKHLTATCKLSTLVGKKHFSLP